MLAAGLLACIAVLWPVHDHGTLADPDRSRWRRQPGRRRWKLHPTIAELEQSTTAAAEPEALDALSAIPAQARRVNCRTLESRSSIFNLACILLAVQVSVWTAILLQNRQ